MDVEVRNKPIIRSRTLIAEKKLDKKVQPIPPTIVEKKEVKKVVKKEKPVIKPKEKKKSTIWNSVLSNNVISKPKEENAKVKEKRNIIPIPDSIIPIKKRIEETTSIQKRETKPKEKTNNENYKQPTLEAIINNMKFAQNAHRAVVDNRDSAKILEPRVDGSLIKSILSDYPYANSSNKINTERIVEEKESTRADETIPSNNGKSAINFICEVDGESYTSDTTGIIVTMTSWTKRIKNVERTIATILNNSVLPEKIIVNLSTSEFPNKESSLPTELVLLAKKNPIIEFHWLKHNTTVWKKIIPTIVRFKNANVICIDDDRLYPKDFIATFKAAADKYPTGPITGANISFLNGYKQHCGHATLDKYAFYRDGLEFITNEVMSLKSSDSVLTIIANRTGHPTQYLGVNYLSQIGQKNNPVAGYSSSNNISVSHVIKMADAMFDKFQGNGSRVVNKPQIENKEAPKPKVSATYNGVALCGIAKMENNYIREWVEHYEKLGFSHIFLYDNNDTDGEHFESVIGDYIKSKFVTVIDVRGETAAQTSSYTNCYNRLAKKYSWVAFFDIDEFLVLDKKYKNISEFVNDSKFSKYNCIRVCWRQFTDGGLLDVENGNYSVRRFKEYLPISLKKASAQTKPIMRTSIKNGLIISSPHGALGESMVRSCTANGVACANAINTNIVTWDGAALNHYRFKTIGEYIRNKIQKGWPTFYGGVTNKFLNVDFFFEYNTRTREKELYAQKVKAETGNKKRSIYISSWVKYDKTGITKRNWGDELNFFFLPKILPYKIIPFRNDTVIDKEADRNAVNYLMIGSVINSHYVNSNTIIWGAGIISEHRNLSDMEKPKKICSVRGPLTRKKLLLSGIDCPEVYGDPALLLPYVYNPNVEKKYKIGFIKHWRTKSTYPNIESCDDVKVISMSSYGDWKTVINEILSCEYIVSESLHGIIIAEAYGIPNLWVDCDLNKTENTDFKFKDFYGSIGKWNVKSFKMNHRVTKEQLLSELSKYERINTLDLNKLIDACPVDIIIKKEAR